MKTIKKNVMIVKKNPARTGMSKINQIMVGVNADGAIVKNSPEEIMN